MVRIRSTDAPELVLLNFYRFAMEGGKESGSSAWIDTNTLYEVRPFDISDGLIAQAIDKLIEGGLVEADVEGWRISDDGLKWMEKLIDLNPEFFEVYFEKGENAISIDEFRALKRP